MCGMALSAKPTREQLAAELLKVAYEGVGRPLRRGKSEADIPHVAAIAREMAVDPTLPLHQLIAEAVIPAVKRMRAEKQRLAVAAVLWIDLNQSSDDDGPQERVRVPFATRRPEAASLLGTTEEYYRKAKMERELFEQVSDQMLALLLAHRRAAKKQLIAFLRELLSATGSAGDVPTPPRRYEAAVGLWLTALGLIWLVALATKIVT